MGLLQIKANPLQPDPCGVRGDMRAGASADFRFKGFLSPPEADHCQLQSSPVPLIAYLSPGINKRVAHVDRRLLTAVGFSNPTLEVEAAEAVFTGQHVQPQCLSTVNA